MSILLWGFPFKPWLSLFSYSFTVVSSYKGSGDSHCTSSLAIRMLSVTSENTVGFMNRPLSSMARPPHSSLAPSFFPLSISSRILSNWFWSICQMQKEKKQKSNIFIITVPAIRAMGVWSRALWDRESSHLIQSWGSQTTTRLKDGHRHSLGPQKPEGEV